MDSAYRDFEVPPVVEEQSRAWLALPEADRTAATPRASSTVMLLRPAATAGVEVFVLRRAASMAFAAGMHAFPGGGVDPRDADPSIPWAGPSPQEWAARMRTDEDAARELVIAAAREVFEEAGVLLAAPADDPERVVGDLDDAEEDAERERLLDRSQSFGEMLARRGLVLRSDLLALRGHWTTPVAEPRRYDTRFFAARMPQGQHAESRTTEAAVAYWAHPTDLLLEQAQGRAVMLPPTTVMLEQLRGVDDLDGWLATPVEVHAVLPLAVEVDGEILMRAPIDQHGHGLPEA